MKAKAERPVDASRTISAWRSRDDRRQMPPGFSLLTPVRKEVRCVGVCAPTHIVDGLIGDAGVSKLKSNQRGEIPVGFCATALDHRTAVCSMLHLSGHLFADLECLDANVRTNCDEELSRIV